MSVAPGGARPTHEAVLPIAADDWGLVRLNTAIKHTVHSI